MTAYADEPPACADYTYHDSDPELEAWNRTFTSRVGNGTGDPEEDFLAVVKLIATCRTNAKCLDIGCGYGRFIEMICDSAESVVGLEPDLKRFLACCDSLRDRDRIQIVRATSHDFKIAHPETRFDIIIVSMVLQHVTTGICDQILADVRDLLVPKGVAVISTAQQHIERFVCQSNSTALTVEEFNGYAADAFNQRWGLPIRNFSKRSFIDAIERADLHIIHWGQFSYVRPEKLAWYAAMVNVPAAAIEDVGVSQYAVVTRTS